MPTYNKAVINGTTYIDLSGDTVEEAALASGFIAHDRNGATITGTALYAAAPVANGNATHTNAILYGSVDSTSTNTVFTATVAGLTSLYDGVCVMLHNGVVTSTANFTVNINGLGAKKCYNNLTNATQDTTIFNVAYTMLFVYSSALDSGNGGWWIYRGYDANTNTIGYQLRTNSGNLVAADTGYRYRIWLTSADGAKWVPINTSTSTNATTARTLNTRKIDPFGPIVYRPANSTCTADTGLGATGIWQQYTLTIGYSYVITLTYPAPVYLRCTPQADGSAVMNDITQALPATNDGKIYIHLGTAYSATAMELQMIHPVYWHDGTALRLWTGAVDSGGDVTMTEAEVDAAVEAGFVDTTFSITVTLTNPISASDFDNCQISQVNSVTGYEESLGTIVTASGTLTVDFDPTVYDQLYVLPNGNWGATFNDSDVSCTGDIAYTGRHWSGSAIFSVSGDGTITIDGIDYGD